jgi:hypothetical protein
VVLGLIGLVLMASLQPVQAGDEVTISRSGFGGNPEVYRGYSINAFWKNVDTIPLTLVFTDRVRLTILPNETGQRTFMEQSDSSQTIGYYVEEAPSVHSTLELFGAFHVSSISSTAVYLTWGDIVPSADQTLTGYQIWRTPGRDGTAQSIFFTQDTDYNDQDIEPGTVYTYRLIGLIDGAIGYQSDEKRAVVPYANRAKPDQDPIDIINGPCFGDCSTPPSSISPQLAIVFGSIGGIVLIFTPILLHIRRRRQQRPISPSDSFAWHSAYPDQPDQLTEE